jgi:hypothetical protein
MAAAPLLFQPAGESKQQKIKEKANQKGSNTHLMKQRSNNVKDLK